LACSARLAHADNAITFSPALPKAWRQLSSQAIPGTNPVTHDSLTANITVVQNTNNLTTLLISVIPIASPEATNNTNIAIDARNWIQGVLDGFAENHKADFSRFEIKTEKKQKFVEAAFRVQLQDAVLHGVSRYSISNTNAVGWVAFGGDPSVESNKTVFGIAASVKLRK
jgi:hypothetical protein